MKVIINRIALLDALSLAVGVARVRSPKPALACVKLSTEASSLSLASTDLECSLLSRIDLVQVEQAGEVLVTADKLRDVAAVCGDDTLSLEVTGDICVIRSSDSVFKLATMNPKDFPPVLASIDNPDLTIPSGEFRAAVSQTIFAISYTDGQFQFTGLFVLADKSGVSFVGTDGKRLAKAVLPHPIKEKKSAIIPEKALVLASKISEEGDDISIKIDETSIAFACGDHAIRTTILEGAFPPYEDITPKGFCRKMTAGSESFCAAIRRAALLMTEDSKGVRLSFSKNGLMVSSRSNDAGESTSNLPLKFEGADLDIGLNAKFVLEAVKAIGADEIVLEINEANRPVLFRSTNPGGPMCVLMPVNLQ